MRTRDWLVMALLLCGAVCIAQDAEIALTTDAEMIEEVAVAADVTVEAAVEAVEFNLKEWLGWGAAVVAAIVAVVALVKRVGWKRATQMLAEEIKDIGDSKKDTPVRGVEADQISKVGKAIAQNVKKTAATRKGRGWKIAGKILDVIL